MRSIIPSIILGLLSVEAANAQAPSGQFLQINTIRNVMVGNSSTGEKQVWLRVDGIVPGVAQDCVYANTTLFYVPSQYWSIGTDQALSMLLTAKSTNTPIQIATWIDGDAADFWGWGISRCKISRISVGP